MIVVGPFRLNDSIPIPVLFTFKNSSGPSFTQNGFLNFSKPHFTQGFEMTIIIFRIKYFYSPER